MTEGWYFPMSSIAGYKCRITSFPETAGYEEFSRSLPGMINYSGPRGTLLMSRPDRQNALQVIDLQGILLLTTKSYSKLTTTINNLLREGLWK